MKRSKDQDNTEDLKIRLAEKTMELKIEAALEKVRAVSLNMHEPSDMLKICKTISKQLQRLGVKEIRNVQTAIFYVNRGTYMNYEFYAKHDKTFITETTYGNNKIHHTFARKMLRGKGEFFVSHIRGDKVKKWIEYQKSTNVFIDRYLKTASSLNYYWHSLGPVALGISTYSPLSKEELDLFHRFLKVFDLAYRRYLDIEKAEKQAREARMEVAVERVRTKALAMHRSDDIHEVVRTLRHELFGLNLEGIMGATICLKQPDGQVRLWDITDIKTTGRYGWDILFDIKNIDPQLWVKKIWDSGKKVTAIEQDSKDLRRALKWLSRYDKKTAGEITKLLKVNKIQHGWHRGVKLTNGILIADFTREPQVETEIILLKIGAAFDLAYKRFLDLQKAEGQARESRIQLALERVRARTMAMQESSELPEAANLLFHQVKTLELPAWSAGYCIWNEDKSAVTLWMSTEGALQPPFTAPTTEDELFIQMRKGHEHRKPLHRVEMGGEKLVKHYRYMRTLPVVGEILDSVIKAGYPLPDFQIMHYAYFSAGFLFFITYEPVPAAHDIFIRFARVFDQTYTRFLDLQKSEAQAREAQIEAALERVRSSSMAMHQSSDLHQVIKVVTEQLCSLRLKFDVANFAKVDEAGNWDLWLSTPAQAYPAQLFVPYLDHPIFNRVLEMRKNQLDHISDVYDQKVKNVFFRHFFKNSEAKHSPESRKKQVLNRKGFARTLFYFKDIWFAISNYEGIPFSAEEVGIFRRFAKAFEQSYIRFLDLQRAEAQAREAQIEAALERVRSRSMAMHRSDELKDVIRLVLQQFGQLNINAEHAGFYIDYKAHEDMHIWLADPKLEPFYAVIPYFDTPTWNSFLEAKANGTILHTDLLDFKTKNKFYRSLFKLFTIPEEAQKFYLKCKGLAVSTVLLDNVGLYIENFSAIPYTDEENNLLIRFGNVFQQTYTRFLDLQKAEAQAREAQIEAALERVRSRTMAMHTSSELIQTAELLFDQLKQLGAELQGVAFAICDKNSVMVQKWTSIGVFNHPYNIEPGEERMYEAWKNQAALYEEVYEGERQKKYYEAFMQIPAFKQGIQKFIDSGHPLPAWQKNHAVPFKFGYLLFITTKPFNETQIFLRFGKVFEQTYTRFLDLQKAEAQARESQIEAAMEKIRSRSLAMHHSSELSAVIAVFFEKLSELNVLLGTVGIQLFDQRTGDSVLWVGNALQEPQMINLPHDDGVMQQDTYLKDGWQAFSTGQAIINRFYSRQQKDRFIDFVFSHNDLIRIPENARTVLRDLDDYYVCLIAESHSALFADSFTGQPYPEENLDVIRRAARVFNQAYIRFLDLQNAEVQAKEAQIQLALERIRARTMAMQKSDELPGTSFLLFQQMKELGLTAVQNSIGIVKEDAGVVELSTTVQGHPEPKTLYVPIDDPHVMAKAVAAWKAKRSSLTLEFHGRELKEYNKLRNRFLEIKVNFPEDHWIVNIVFFSKGWLSFSSDKNIPGETLLLMERFAGVFDGTYTRFLDLQKAETQAREAQIEAALERVRARAMAMHSSQELNEVVHELRKQMGLLGQKDLETCVIHLNEESSDYIHSWAAIRPPEGEGEILVDSTARVPKKGLRIIEEAMEAYSSHRQDYILLNEGDKLKQWFSFLEKESPRSYSRLVDSVQGKIADLRAFWSFADFTGGSLLMVTMEAPDDATRGLLRKFANVFGLAYRRFADLKQAEAQAKEAEIQLALERVRARSLAMHHTSELQEVVNVTAQQLLGIGMDIDGGVFICINAEVGTGLSIWASGGMADYVEKIVVPVLNKPIFTRIRDAIKKGNTFLIESFTDQEKRTFFDHLFQYEPWQSLSQERKEALLSRTGGFARSVVISRHTSISITNHHGKAFSEQENEVLKRFGKVFEQSYTRFLDLQKAEAQAREAEIELGLERVRARAMAMQSSEELSTLIGTVFTELTKLDLALTRCIIWVFEPATHAARWWMANSEEPSRPMSFYIKHHEHPAYLTFVREWKNQNVKFVYDLKGQDKINWDDLLFNETELSNLSDAVKNGMKAPERVLLSASFNNFGGINVASLEPLSNEHFDILLRFAKVFDLTYTRFLDLKNAEAQAREAQVEAALERVRSQAMAMRQSGDLLDIVVTMRNEFTRLGHEAHYFWYMRWLPDRYEKAMTSGDGTRIGMIMSLPRHIHGDIPLVAHWEKSEEPALVYAMDVDAALNYVDKMVALGDFELVDPHAPSHDDIRRIQGLTFIMARTMHGEIGYSLPGVVSNPPEEDLKTLVRFANVFDLAYRRFEDLKEAENRNRETQIELALERTRTKTMLMQHSDELLEISKVFHQQLLLLGIDSEFSFVWLPNEEKGDHLFWATWMQEKDGTAAFHTRAITYPLDLTEPYTAKCFEDWRSGVPVHEHFIAPENIETFFASWEELLEGAEGLKPVFFPEGIYYTEAFMKYGCFGIDIRRPLSQQEQSILHRFAIEFERTYTRFLDLQKAEAQAKEAQIQLALERVRARTMAMHQSDELREVVSLLFKQIKGLGFEAFMCSILLLDESKRGYQEFMSSDEQSVLPQIYKVPYLEDPFHDKFMAAFNEGLSYKVFELGGKEKREYDKKVFTLTDFRFLPEESKQMMMDTLRCSICCAYTKHGCIVAVSDQELDSGHSKVLQRFAKVFDQTYIRFLDLQRAEEQAREAQIEAALEKVRSRSLAMHKSDELKEVVVVVFEKLKELGLTFDVAGIQLYTGGTRDIVQWVAAPGLASAPVLANLPFIEDDYQDSEIIRDVWTAKESGKNFSKHYSFQEKNKFFAYAHRHNDIDTIPEVARQIQMQAPGYTQSLVAEKHSALWVDSYSGQTISEEEFNVLGRFARVFEQAYVRFLDLQKAEAQAREAQIEASLERVRARTMAMHRSEELVEVSELLYNELRGLGVSRFINCGYVEIDETNNIQNAWMTVVDGSGVNAVRLPLTGEQVFNERYDAWKRKEKIFHQSVGGELLKRHIEFGTQHYRDTEIDEFVRTRFADPTIFYCSNFSQGYLHIITDALLSVQDELLLIRFTTVFEMTYKRFLDLQKAEAQVRESQIQLALERVRARTMAMQKSNELPEAANILFQQVQSLGFPTWTAGYCIWDEDKKAITLWMSRPWGDIQPPFRVPLDENPTFIRYLEAHNEGLELYIDEISGKSLEENYKYLLTLPVVGEQLESILAEGHPLPTYEVDHCAYFSKGFLLFITYQQVPEAHDIFKRFAKVFEQTYTRFLDLQKAEAQAREAQIESALERVRSRSLAMHRSDELEQVAGSLFEAVVGLGIAMDGALLFVFNRENKNIRLWIATVQLTKPVFIDLPHEEVMKDNQVILDYWNTIEIGGQLLNRVYSVEAKNDYFRYVHRHNGSKIPDQLKQLQLELPAWNFSFVAEKNTMLGLDSWSGHLFAEADLNTLRRFSRVFEQAYTRFLDLQRAEAQTREARIEASLERVRSKAMAMHSSQDLAATIQTFYRELNSLNLTPRRCGVGLIDRETRMSELSTMNTTSDGESIEILGKLVLENHFVLEGVYEHWLAQEEYHPVLRGNEIREYYQLLRPQIQFPEYPQDAVQYGHFFFFDEGGVYAWTEKPLAEDELKIYRRFTSVLSLTYKRYRDLRNAEARAKEAVRQASLDRLRAEIASMRTAADLDRITPLIWKELTTLGIPFVRCGVFIMDEPNNQIHTYLSTPDGRAIAAFHLPLDNPGNLGEAVQYWREHKAYVTRWVDTDFQAQADLLAHLGAVDSRDEYLSNVPADGIYLHLSPFRQGMLYVGNTAPLSDTELDLVQSLSDAFSVAYARYDDFRQLEMAKKDVENALAGLKQAQQQLVQSEKMASLGELTAGIAHEIQNPLNFVNNFAEVNAELIEEIRQAIQAGNSAEVLHLTEDLKQNLIKINFHGKRADGIVKSMLQHSRSGDAGGKNKKEPTDLNKLAEEYLRLAYHGLRAKDKSFNAALHTDFDDTVGLIEVSGQDLARAILNLINNAFYAVQDKEKRMKSRGEPFTPQVSLITKRTGQTVEIRIKDNGPGIPEEVRDKIFQPFFTTKPAGQGTGLGLSLAYDIVKAHGGNIHLNSTPEGSDFQILLPST